MLDLNSLERADGVDDAPDVLLVTRKHGDVAHLLPPLDPNEVDRAEEAARVADRGS